MSAVTTPAIPLQSLSVVDMVLPDQSNHHGTLFGGAALSALDRLAFIMGSKVLHGTIVTAAVSKLDFAAPVPAGSLIECTADVIEQGNRSITIRTHLFGEELISGKRVLCLSGDFVMVKKNDLESAEQTTSATVHIPTETLLLSTDPIIRVAEIIFPGHANHRGILHGGPAMGWLAKAGFVAATRRMRQTMVMASSEKMDFIAPAYVGDIVEVLAQVSRVGNRSVTIGAEVWAESTSTGLRRLCTASSLVYVAINH